MSTQVEYETAIPAHVQIKPENVVVVNTGKPTPAEEGEDVATVPANTSDSIRHRPPPHRYPPFVVVTLENLTGHDLTLKAWAGNKGNTWNPAPPDSIPLGKKAVFRVESHATYVPASGWVLYQFSDKPERDIVLKFTVPFFGDNTFESDVPEGWGCTITGGTGRYAIVEFTIQPVPT